MMTDLKKHWKLPPFVPTFPSWIPQMDNWGRVNEAAPHIYKGQGNQQRQICTLHHTHLRLGGGGMQLIGALWITKVDIIKWEARKFLNCLPALWVPPVPCLQGGFLAVHLHYSILNQTSYMWVRCKHETYHTESLRTTLNWTMWLWWWSGQVGVAFTPNS